MQTHGLNIAEYCWKDASDAVKIEIWNEDMM